MIFAGLPYSFHCSIQAWREGDHPHFALAGLILTLLGVAFFIVMILLPLFA